VWKRVRERNGEERVRGFGVTSGKVASWLCGEWTPSDRYNDFIFSCTAFFENHKFNCLLAL